MLDRAGWVDWPATAFCSPLIWLIPKIWLIPFTSKGSRNFCRVFLYWVCKIRGGGACKKKGEHGSFFEKSIFNQFFNP